jgi:RNA-binding protein YlmH
MSDHDMRDALMHVRPAERTAYKRLFELAQRSAAARHVQPTPFLTPREAELGEMAASRAGTRAHMWGGYRHAERRRILFAACPPDTSAYEVTCILADAGDGDEPPAHGDYLGSLLAIGLERDRFGDIVVTGCRAHIFVAASMASVLLRDYGRAGRRPLRLRTLDGREVTDLPAPVLQERVVTMQSLRLDAFVGHAFGMSRTKALEPIRAGKVQLNFTVCDDPSEEIAPGDIVSVRGLGRARILAAQGQSKSGRTFVRLGRYV